MATVTNNAEIHVKVVGTEAAKAQLAWTGTNLKSLRTSAIMAGVAIAGLAAAIASTLRPAMEQEKALSDLEASLKNTGIYTAQFSKALQETASSLQSMTIYGDEAILTATGLMQAIGNISKEELPKAQKAAIGLAAAYKMDLTTAFQLVGKASAGNTATLARYGVVLDDGMTKAEKFSKVIAIGTSKFGLAEAAAKTTSGQIQQLKNAWGDMMETIGLLVTPVFKAFVAVVRPLVETFGQMHAGLKLILVILPLVTAAYYSMMASQIAAGAVSGTLLAAFTAIRVALAAFATTMGPVGLALTGLTVLVTGLAFAFGGTKKEIDKVNASFGEMAASASRDLVKFDNLANTFLTLGNKIDRTAEETKLYHKAVKDLQTNYAPYLKNLDLEKAKYNEIAAALANVRAGLYSKMQASLQTKALEQFEDEMMGLYGLQARLKREYKPGQTVQYGPIKTTYELAEKRLADGIKYYQDKALEIANMIDVPPPPAGFEEAAAAAGIMEGNLAAGNEAAKEFATSLQDLTLDIANYSKQALNAQGSGNAMFDALNAGFNEWADLRARIKDLFGDTAEANPFIAPVDEAFIASNIEIYTKYYQDNLNLIKESVMSETDLIEAEYTKRIADFDSYAETARTALAGLLTYQILTEQEYNAKLAELSALGVQILDKANQDKLKKLAEYSTKHESVIEEAAIKELSAMEELGADIKNMVVNGFAGAFADAIVEGENFAKSMQQLFKDLVRMILAELAKLAILSLFKTALGVGTGGGSLLVTALSAGSKGYSNVYPASTPSYMTPTITGNNLEARIDRLAQIVEKNRPIVYTQVIEGIPFANAVDRAYVQRNAL